jgi:hypothetical protein
MSEMDDLEREEARKEAGEAASKATQSANRARLWAGLNKYLAVEAEHAHKAARAERDRREKESADKAGHRNV